jgi:hypothetical protein
MSNTDIKPMPDTPISSFTDLSSNASSNSTSSSTLAKPSYQYTGVNDNLFLTDKYNLNDNTDATSKKNTWHWVQVTIACTIRLILTIIAGYLSWNCSASSPLILRILITFASLLFSEIYIIYYAIYRVYMGNKCPV